jgi:hypothetical protein
MVDDCQDNRQDNGQDNGQITARIWPPVAQLAFGRWNPTSTQRLATRGQPGRVVTEDIEMFAQRGLFSSIGRATVMATVAAVALTAMEPSLALAAPAGKGQPAVAATHNITDFSSRGRVYRGRGYGGAAAAAAFAGIVGTGIAIAATQNRRDYYDSYGYAPGYYGGGPVYYGGGPAYYGGYGSSVPYFHGHPNAGW